MDSLNRSRVCRIFATLIPFFILIILYISRGYFPFGQRGILASDLYHQYMPFFQEFQTKLQTGESLQYSLNLGIGTNFPALYIYYLASPFNWLCALIPSFFLMEFIAFLILIKLSLCGLTACIYFQSKSEKETFLPAVFGLLYAFSGYLCAYYYNIMWLDIVMLAPLVVLGLEKLVKEGKWKLYAITLGLSILSNFYLSIMLCMFLVLYYVFLFLTEKRPWKSVLRFGAASLLAGGMAAVLLVPEVLTMLGSDFVGGEFPTEFKTYFGIHEVLTRHCMGVTVEKALAHWPNIYCGALMFLLVPMYLLDKKTSIGKKLGNLFLLLFFLAGFSIANLDYIWHGMNYPDSLPARQSFLYILLVLTMGYEALRHLTENPKWHIAAAGVLAVGFLTTMAFLGLDEDFKDYTIWINLGFAAAYGVLMFLICLWKGTHKQMLMGILLGCLIIGECTANMALTSLTSINRDSYLKEVEDNRALFKAAKEERGSFFRVEKFSRKTKNDGALQGIPMASTFSSTQNADAMRFFKRFGMRYSKVYFCYDGATPFLNCLLNVDYRLDEDVAPDRKHRRESDAYHYVADSGISSLYESIYRVPFGYTLPYEFDVSDTFTGSGISLQNNLAKKLVNGRLFVQEKPQKTETGISFEATEDGYYFGVLKKTGIKAVVVTGGPLMLQTIRDLKSDETIEIGQLSRGEAITIENEDTDGKVPSVDIYRMDPKVMQALVEELSAQHLENASVWENRIEGDLLLTTPRRLVLSVPYEKGWRVLVNGEECIPNTFGNSLMALDLEAGEYHIEACFEIRGLGLGLVISAINIAILAFFFVWPKIKEKRLATSKKMMQNDSHEVDSLEKKEVENNG